MRRCGRSPLAIKGTSCIWGTKKVVRKFIQHWTLLTSKRDLLPTHFSVSTSALKTDVRTDGRTCSQRLLYGCTTLRAKFCVRAALVVGGTWLTRRHRHKQSNVIWTHHTNMTDCLRINSRQIRSAYQSVYLHNRCRDNTANSLRNCL
jgi:hypothetical protein